MLMFVEFDINADIIDVPQSVIDNKEYLSRSFLKWLYDKRSEHKYLVTINGSKGMLFRSEAFVEWLNKKVLKESSQKAVVVQQEVSRDNEQNLPSVFF